MKNFVILIIFLFLVIIACLYYLFSTGIFVFSPKKKTIKSPLKNSETSSIISQISEKKLSPEEVVKLYYEAGGQKEWSKTFSYIAKASQISKSEYLSFRAEQEKNTFVSGVKSVSIEDAKIEDDKATVWARIEFELLVNPLTDKKTNLTTEEIKLLKEDGQWKILWEMPKDEPLPTFGLLPTGENFQKTIGSPPPSIPPLNEPPPGYNSPPPLPSPSDF